MSFAYALKIKTPIGVRDAQILRQNITLNDNFNWDQMNFLKEFFLFLQVKKKLWLAPIVLVMVLIGGLLILAQGSVVAPFIYTLF